MSQTPFNPFEHHHHHHDDGPPVRYEDMDPAQKSLADALRVSFVILKIVMIGLIVIYLCSGIFIVKSGEVAIVMRFGGIAGEGEGRVVQPGSLNFSFPFPIDQVVRVPSDKNKQMIALDSAFWYERDQSAQTPNQAGTALNPERHGSLITGDANIVHARFEVVYHVADPVKFVRTLADLDIAAGQAMLHKAELIVRAAAEEGVVHAIAQVEADKVIRQSFAVAIAEARVQVQKTLDALECGIRIDELRVNQTAMPLKVRSAYQEVINATNEAQNRINKATETARGLVGGAAGDAHEVLWQMIQDYEVASEAARSADPAEADAANRKLAELDAAFEQAFNTRQVTTADGRAIAIGGDAAALINEAESYYSQVVAAAERDARAFKDLLEKYKRNPRTFVSREWQNTKERILNDWRRIELFYLPEGHPYIRIPRSPELKDRRDKDRITRQNNQGRQSGGANAAGDE